MAFLNSTPQEEIATIGDEMAEKSKQAMIWFAVIAVIVLVIMFGSKK